MARSSDLTRTLDQSIGSVIARAAGLVRRSRPMPGDPHRIALIQPTAIGDTLIGSGCIAALHEKFPKARLIVCHGPSNGAAVKMLATPVEPVQIGFANPAKAVAALRALKADMIVDLTPWPYSTALCARLSAPWSAGFNPAGSARGKLFDLAVPHSARRHEIENLDALAKALGTGGETGMAIKRDPAQLPADWPLDRLVLCHVSAGGARAAAKAWPDDHWVRLANGLAAAGYTVGFTGVPNDEPAVQRVMERLDDPAAAVSLCGKVSLAGLAEMLAAVPLLVTVDTGVLHLSAAVQGCSIGLHGPTRAARWGSVSPRATGMDAPHPAGGYISYGFESHPQEMEIMATLTPEAVLERALALLADPKERA
ncbi:glycosyltransferase family 9 protein [Acidimangrovimonas pyrenivorans]|uniref:Glycosyltransferase family 9 protein n=1 Tax=Acidimangrovimonas pyrenivorans TaxID=2030798 RepID=A0ABV7ANP5_9RHOB